MNHWQMIAAAYLLTFAALAVEVVLLVRRRRWALRQVRAWLDSDESQAADGEARAGAPAGAGAGARAAG